MLREELTTVTVISHLENQGQRLSYLDRLHKTRHKTMQQNL